MKVMDKRELGIRTHYWPAFGNDVPNAATAANELIQNGYAAGISTGNTLVDVTVSKEIDGTYITVKNAGVPADVQKVLDYGLSTQETALNQFGTGFKTAMSYFNPSNDAWEFWTRENDHSLRVSAPYSDVMNVEVINGWPFEEKFVSCAKVRVEDEECLEVFDIDEMGFRYSFAIENGLRLFFNGERVHPIRPCGKAETQEKIIDFANSQAKITLTTYELGRDSIGNRFYAMGLTTQGIYLFANHSFVKFLGFDGVIKNSKESGKRGKPAYLKQHPSMNGYIALVDIETPASHEADIPFNNNKSIVKWGGSKAGRIYRSVIDESIGDFFRDQRHDDSEKGKIELVRGIISGMAGVHACYYQEEVRLGKALRADAVVSTEMLDDKNVDLSKAEYLVEYKNKNVNAGHIGQLFNYYTYVAATYDINPIMVFIADTIDKEAREQMARYEKLYNVTMTFISWADTKH